MYWFSFLSRFYIHLFFLGIIQGFIFRDYQIRSLSFPLIRDCTRVYAKKFPWLENIDGEDNGEKENSSNNGNVNNEVIQWNDKSNMHSLKGELYIASDLPENDIVELTGQQVNLIAKTWYNYVLSELFDDSKDVDNLEKMKKVKEKSSTSCLFHNMNKLESTYNKNVKYRYYVWLPDKKKSEHDSDILACFAVEDNDINMCLVSILINPMWTSDNIALKCLKKSICAFNENNKTIDINDFYEDEKNERIVLEWLF